MNAQEIITRLAGVVLFFLGLFVMGIGAQVGGFFSIVCAGLGAGICYSSLKVGSTK